MMKRSSASHLATLPWREFNSVVNDDADVLFGRTGAKWKWTVKKFSFFSGDAVDKERYRRLEEKKEKTDCVFCDQMKMRRQKLIASRTSDKCVNNKRNETGSFATLAVSLETDERL